jgi:hypothetical protein
MDPDEFRIFQALEHPYRVAKWGWPLLGVLFVATPVLLGSYVPERDLRENVSSILVVVIFAVGVALWKYLDAIEKTATLKVAHLLREAGCKGDVLEMASITESGTPSAVSLKARK